MQDDENNEVEESTEISLEDAWDAQEALESGESDDDQPDGEDPIAADDGEAAPTDGEPEGEVPPDPAAEAAGGEAPEAQKEYDEDTGLYYDVAPQGWKASTREQWKSIPADVRKDIVRRERDFAVGVQKHAEAAQYGHRMNQMLQPMQPFFQAGGMNGEQGLQSVLQTASMLMGGQPQQKAEAVASMIQQYGVDLQSLDQLLAGQHSPQQGGPDPQVQQAIQQAVQPYQQFMSQMQQRQQQHQQAQQQQVATTVQEFAQNPQNEFYSQVRGDMATLLDLAAQRNENLSLEDAYQQACNYNADIRSVIEQRAARNNPQNKQAASTSIIGEPDGGGVTKQPETLRDALLDAWGS